MEWHVLKHPVDRELRLVPPSPGLVDAMLYSCQHPLGLNDSQSAWTRQQLIDFVTHYPGGIDLGNEFAGLSPGYYFWMQIDASTATSPRDAASTLPPIPMAGTLSFRLSQSNQVRLYSGHIGYGVFAPARGRHYAQRAVQLITPLARLHGMDHLIITCNPDNLPSRRTCERLGATLLETVDIPEDNVLYRRGDRQKCRYRLDV